MFSFSSLRPLALTVALALPVYAQTTGFNQPGGGTFDYNNSSFWVSGDINGIWHDTLTVTADQTLTFGGNTTLSTGLLIDNGSSASGSADLTFRGNGPSDFTLTLGNNITVSPTNNQLITIGSTTANQNLNVALGGNRTFTVESGDTLRFFGSLTGGNITSVGGGTLQLSAFSSAATSAVNIGPGGTLNVNSSASGNSGATRAASLTLENAILSTNGNNTVASTETFTGAITFDATARNRLATISLAPGTTKDTLSANSISRAHHAVGLVRGTNLGTNPIASGAGSNIVLGTGPALVGGGGSAGTTNISIVPWLLGGTTTSDGGSTLVTYDSTSGLRPLNTATEFATTLAASAATDNVRIIANETMAGDRTVNSLVLAAGADLLAGTGTLAVTSGALFFTQNATSTAPIDFGSAEGIIGFERGMTFSSAVAGSGGVTIYTSRSQNDEGFTWNTPSTYTGDTHVLAGISVNTNGVLPSGSRTGNVHVLGAIDVRGDFTINGLNGAGLVNGGGSGTVTLSVGDNNASGDFSGTLADFGTLNLIKIGSGTQTLSGVNSTNQGATTILGGVLEVAQLANGGANSSIGNSTNVATKLVINGGTLRHVGAGSTTDRLFQIGQTGNNETGTIDSSGSGALVFTNTGNVAYGTAATVSISRTRTLVLTGTNTGANTLSLVIGNNGTQTNGNSAVSLAKNGNGRWILTATNTYTGSTSINAGSLIVNGSLANTSGVSLAANARLGGSGSIAGKVTTGGSNATFSPGNSPGTLTLSGGLDATLGATFEFELGTTSDLISLGSGILTGSTAADGLIFNFSDSGGLLAGTPYTLITYGSATGLNDSDLLAAAIPSGFVLDSSFGTDGFQINGGSLQVQFTSVPEPSAGMLVLLGAALFTVCRRKR